MKSPRGHFRLSRRAVAGGWSAVLCCAVAVLPWATAAGAQSDGGIRVTVDRNQVALGTQIYMTVRIDGSPDEPPRLPELPDFRVVSRGQQRSTQIDNLSVSHSTSYNYLLIPTRAGTFDVGAATAVIDGVEVTSQPFRIEVAAAEDHSDERDRDLFVTANVSTDRPWQGQQVIYTWRFYSRVPVGQGSIESMEFGNDVVVEDLGEVRQFQATIEGVGYSVNEVRKALFPQRSGELTLPQTQLRVEVQVEQARRPSRRRSIFDDFDDLLGGGGRWVTKYLLTEPLTLNVRPLPPAPQGWNGLVGDFDIRAQLSRRELQVGQSATLEVQVGGTGNVQLLSEPGFPELPTFKIYPDQPDANIDRSGRRLTGRKVFRRALVPLVAGPLEIPPIDLVYFDPELGEYATRSTDRIDLDVVPAEGEEELMLTESLAPTTGKVAVRILADDILPIRRTAAGIVSAAPQGWRLWVWFVCGVLPPFMYLALLTHHRRERRYAADRTLRRRQRALRDALSAAKKVRSGVGPGSAAEASGIVRRYVGDKLGLEGSALTPSEAESALVRAGVDGAVASRCRTQLERLEAAQYGLAAVAGGGGLAAETSTEGLSDLIRTIDRQVRGRRP
ncbi:MAG: BatD family protein [Acidobacteria bacterium]|nr:BatD family protein [Acidobacteriota bacterium]